MSVEFEQDSTAEDDLPKVGPRLVRSRATGEGLGGHWWHRSWCLLKFLEGKRGCLKIDVLGDFVDSRLELKDPEGKENRWKSDTGVLPSDSTWTYLKSLAQERATCSSVHHGKVLAAWSEIQYHHLIWILSFIIQLWFTFSADQCRTLNSTGGWPDSNPKPPGPKPPSEHLLTHHLNMVNLETSN